MNLKIIIIYLVPIILGIILIILSYILVVKKNNKYTEKREETKINYKVTNMEKLNSFYTRYESKMIDDLINYLKQIQKNSNDYETKYIYFECFNKEIDSSKKAYEKLFNSVNKLDFKVIEKLKNLMKVLKK